VHLSAQVRLGVEHNNFSGPLPSFAACPALRHLSVHHNEFSGELPEFAENPLLETLVLSHNEFRYWGLGLQSGSHAWSLQSTA